jgi:hypothetical protein
VDKEKLNQKLEEVNRELRQSEITYSQLKGQKLLLEELLKEEPDGNNKSK